MLTISKLLQRTLTTYPVWLIINKLFIIISTSLVAWLQRIAPITQVTVREKSFNNLTVVEKIDLWPYKSHAREIPLLISNVTIEFNDPLSTLMLKKKRLKWKQVVLNSVTHKLATKYFKCSKKVWHKIRRMSWVILHNTHVLDRRKNGYMKVIWIIPVAIIIIEKCIPLYSLTGIYTNHKCIHQHCKPSPPFHRIGYVNMDSNGLQCLISVVLMAVPS